MAGGANTSKSGKLGEAMLRGWLESLGYESMQYSDDPSHDRKRVLFENCPYEGVFSQKSKYEFLLQTELKSNKLFAPDNDGMTRIVFECKYQAVTGSVDEKLFFVKENFIHLQGEGSEFRNFVCLLLGPYYNYTGNEHIGSLSRRKRIKELAREINRPKSNIYFIHEEDAEEWLDTNITKKTLPL